jgi:hypothetical protein
MESHYDPWDHYPFVVPGLPAVYPAATGHETQGIASAFSFLDACRTCSDLSVYFFAGAADQIAVSGGMTFQLHKK